MRAYPLEDIYETKPFMTNAQQNNDAYMAALEQARLLGRIGSIVVLLVLVPRIGFMLNIAGFSFLMQAACSQYFIESKEF